MRKTEARVWHNPEIEAPRMGGKSRSKGSSSSRVDPKHRRALEALFTPSSANGTNRGAADATAPNHAMDADHAQDRSAGRPEGARAESRPNGGRSRIVLAGPREVDPKELERERLLEKVLRAEGRSHITKCVNEYAKAGFELPHTQDVQLQLLEHSDEERVLGAIDALAEILREEAPKRKAVLESRLRRIEEFADDEATQLAARRLKRHLTGRSGADDLAAP